MTPLTCYLLVSALLFSIGLFGLLLFATLGLTHDCIPFIKVT